MSALYTRDILRLAADSAQFQRLDDPDSSAERRSPVCGSRVRVELTWHGGKVATVGGDVNACAFGQAATALMAASAPGRTRAEIDQAAGDLRDYLGGKRADPGEWPGLHSLAPACATPTRHAAILLPFEALAEAARNVAERD